MSIEALGINRVVTEKEQHFRERAGSKTGVYCIKQAVEDCFGGEKHRDR